MTPVRVAVLGFWHVHAADYARVTQRHPGTELVAVWDDDAERGRQGAASFGVTFLDDLDALLRRTDIDAVTVTTATSAHREVMMRAANAGKHIFTEKLLAPTVPEAQDIVRAVVANDVRLMVSLPRLYAGYTAAIDAMLEDGRLGQVTYGRVRLSHDGALPRGDQPAWLPERFFDPAQAVGGALTDLGCHPAYLVQRFLGLGPEILSSTFRFLTGRAVEDHAIVTVGYPDGAVGVIEAGFVSRDPFSIEIHGTRGWLHYDDRRLIGGGAAFEGDEPVVLPVPADGPSAFSQWVEHITRRTRADDNVQRAVELTRLVSTANLAAAEGRTLTYPRG